MRRERVWLVAAGVLLVGLSSALAWRDFRTEPRPAGATGAARYQVVTVNESEIIRLDAVTGSCTRRSRGT